MTSLKLFLFDLDGTLVTTGGAGRRALSLAFKELYGIDNAHERISLAGRTDPAIFREIFELSFNRAAESHEVPSIIECYLGHLAGQIKTSTVKPLPGVTEFVDQVSRRRDIVCGLGTGNVERGARIKLEPAKLNPYFSFGGFGSDHEDRAEMLRHGHRRAQQRTEQQIPTENVFVIGDTLLDISAAKKAGFKSVAVASGSSNLDTLRTGNPDYAISAMTEAHSLLEQL